MTGSEKRTRKPDAPTVQWQGTCDGGAQREEARRGEDRIDDGVGHRRAGGIRNKERNGRRWSAEMGNWSSRRARRAAALHGPVG